jgi:hypothetical protein
MALPRRAKALRCESEWKTLSTPRWLTITLKLSSRSSPSHSFIDHS